jgi:hypothetical protein
VARGALKEALEAIRERTEDVITLLNITICKISSQFNE